MGLTIFLKPVVCMCMVIFSLLLINSYTLFADNEVETVDLSKWNNAKEINVSEAKTININESSDEFYYVFTADSGNYYEFKTTGDVVQHRYGIYDSDGVAIFETYEYSTSKESNYNFRLSEGEKYYIVFGAQRESQAGSYTTQISSLEKNEIISITCQQDFNYYAETGKNVNDDIKIDYETNTITLNNYHGLYIIINTKLYNSCEEFTIVVNGDCVLARKGNGSYIWGDAVKLTIKGEGTLTIGSGRKNDNKGYIHIVGELICDCKKIVINNNGDANYNPIECVSFTNNEIGGFFTQMSGDILVNVEGAIKEEETCTTISYPDCILLRKDVCFNGGGFRVHYIYPDDLNTEKEVKIKFAFDDGAVFNSYIGKVYAENESQVILIVDEELKDLYTAYLHSGTDKGVYYDYDGIIRGSVIDLNDLKVNISDENCTYDGTEKTPIVTIAGLEEGTDFTVEYENNIDVGTGKAIVTGVGLYTGSKIIEFEILDKEDEINPDDGKTPSADDGKPSNSEKEADGPKKGKTIKDKKYIYKVVKAGSSDGSIIGELTVIGLKKKSLTTIKIAAKVTINGITYKVTSVGKNAFENNKKITKAFIGKNVKIIKTSAFEGCKKLKQVSINSKVLKTIGKNAFNGDKKLKKIIIKSKKLKKIGNKALKGTSKKLVVRVPKKKKKEYRKKLKKAGNKKVKVKA